MKRFQILALSLLLTLFATQMFAQATRTWVSGVGDDANPCSRTAPCKTFAGAISKTAAGGEINAIDPGGFGTVTITKSITINGAGTLASVLAAGTNGITVNAGLSDSVTLRELDINGAGTGLTGIRVLSAGRLTIENVHIQNLTTSAIALDLTTGVNLTAYIKNVTAHYTGSHGISVTPNGSATARVDFDRVSVTHVGGNGIYLFGAGTTASIARSTFAFANGSGVAADFSAAADVFDSTSFRNANGLQSSNSGVIRFWGSQVSSNTSNGINILSAGLVQSHGNNAVQGNAGNSSPSSNIGLQ
jgi:hypothetical protein